MNIKEILKSAKRLTNKEKAMLAHCLISSLDSTQEEDVEEAWVKLAEKRFEELKSGKIDGVSWNQLKNEIRA